MRPRLLDLFCCAGGAAVGYHRAGFDVVGVDITPQKHYPFEFHQADVLDVLFWMLTDLDLPVTLCGSSFGLGVRRHRLFEAIPPAYTEYIGKQLLAHIRQEMAA